VTHHDRSFSPEKSVVGPCFSQWAVAAQITFIVDDQGHATELVLHQNGRERHAKRLE
jgi:hypothetical protein